MKKQSFTHSRKPKFGMRKLSIGLASCMLGMMFLTTGHVNADDDGYEGGTLMLVPEQRGNGYSYRSDIEDFQADKRNEKVYYTKWLDGVTVDEREFRKIQGTDGTSYWAAPLLNDRGYFDINKDFNEDSDKCSAAVATNMLLYWFDKNQDNIKKFLDQDPQHHGVVEGEPEFKLVDFLSPYEREGYKDSSKLFEFISKNFNRPVWTDKLLDAYINGYGYIDRYERNDPYSRRNDSKFNFFKKVFDGKLLTDVHTIWEHGTFSSKIREALYTGKAIGLSYGSAGLRRSLGHIVSVWGADLDEKGNVVAVYVTDSDDKKVSVDGKRIGLKRYKTYSDEVGRARLTAYASEGTGGEIRGVWTLDDARYDWADYFKNPEQSQ